MRNKINFMHEILRYDYFRPRPNIVFLFYNANDKDNSIQLKDLLK